jgi:serine/threonine-protein kinase
MGHDIALLFRATANLTPEERARYCQEHDVSSEACAELESLMLFDRSETGSLTGCVADAAGDAFRGGSEDLAGRRYGPWEIVRLLGGGGMGAVYLARRADGEVEQTVAVKLIRDWADGAFFRENFLREPYSGAAEPPRRP